MSVERAERDLDALDTEASRLKKRLAEIDAQANRLRVYVQVARDYETFGEAHKNVAICQDIATSAPSRRGITEVAVQRSIALLRAEGRPLHTRVLLTRLALENVIVGGSNPVANLSGFLSREKSRLKNSRIDGWSLREWDDAQATIGADVPRGLASIHASDDMARERDETLVQDAGSNG